MMPEVTIVTPWRNHPELIPDYEAAVRGAEVVVVDNNSDHATAVQIRDMVERLDGIYLRNYENRWFSAACNQGFRAAHRDIILFLNNDIVAEPGWLAWVPYDVLPRPPTLAGRSIASYTVAGHEIAYIEGWCVAAYRETWAMVRGWDSAAYPMPYWEDVDLSFRARLAGIRLIGTTWPVRHKGNVTTKTTLGAEDAFHANHATLEERVKRAYAI